MHKARFRAYNLCQVSEESDDVVFDLALDRVDPSDVEFGVLAPFPNRLRGLLRDDAQLGHSVGRVRLDFKPDAVARLRVPDRGHLGTGVAWDHTGGPILTFAFLVRYARGCSRSANPQQLDAVVRCSPLGANHGGGSL